MMLEVRAPYDLSLIETLPLESGEGVYDRAEAVFREGPLPLPERLEILRRAKGLIAERFEALAVQAAREGGKPLIDSRVEVQRGIEGIDCAIQTMMTRTGEKIPMGVSKASEGRIAWTVKEPRGICLAISAFNHPFNLIIHQVIPAVAVGCPVIVKPARRTPLSCRSLVEILYEAGLPEAWCQMVICDTDVTEQFVRDPRTAFLSFIGSAAVGWKLKGMLPPQAHCTLEHGGAAPVIVHKDANVERMLPLLAKGGFYHAGQVCVSVQRVFVHPSLVDQVAYGLADLAKKLTVGDPTSPETDVGPMISPNELKRVDEWVKASGGKVLCGGKAISETCYKPTVIVDPDPGAKVSTAEIFGPVVCCYSTDDVREANRLPFSFQAAVFGQDIDRVLKTAEKLKGTTVLINDHTAFRVDWMPFGGEQQSGFGRGGIPYAIDDLSTEKMIVLRS